MPFNIHAIGNVSARLILQCWTMKSGHPSPVPRTPCSMLHKGCIRVQCCSKTEPAFSKRNGNIEQGGRGAKRGEGEEGNIEQGERGVTGFHCPTL